MKEWVPLLKWIWRGKSARRAFLNMEVATCLKLHGLVLDAGGKGQPSYREAVAKADNATWVVVDLFPNEHITACGDLTCLPFKNNMFNAILCFNVLEHVWDYRRALAEMGRVLKEGGRLYGYVPFICNVHPDPFDYWRFTDQCLMQIVAESGLTVESIKPKGGVFVSCFDLVSFTARWLPLLRVALAVALLLADRTLGYVRPSYAERFPVGYFFVARKGATTYP